MTTTAAIPAVAYLRRSTDRQEQSLGDQRREIRRWADENGYGIIREYVDDAISGTSADKRPAFQQMVADAKGGEFQAVVVWNSDRFSRGDVTETEHYRYLLREAGVTLRSVTEDYLHREGIDGDVLRTVKQFQNRQFSISLSQNTLRGQLGAVLAESDPGRITPYGYDREILGPDGSLLYRIRFCEGGVREVYGADGALQASYGKGQSLRKPGKECKARLVESDPGRVAVVRDIFRMCLEGKGFKGIADALNARGTPSPRGGPWSHTTIKSLLQNPVYRGDVVWNRRSLSKFYSVRNGRAEKLKGHKASSKVVKMPEDEWVVLHDGVPALVSREDWKRAQAMVASRRRARGGAGHQKRRWLLSGVLRCGDCGHRYWGERKRKGRIPGRRRVVTNYYTCAGRRTCGKHVCPTPSHIKADDLEAWVLGKLANLVLADVEGVEEAIDLFVSRAMQRDVRGADAERIAEEMKRVDETVTALTTNIDPANLALLNDRLTQLRRRKEHLEAELRAAKGTSRACSEHALRQWARERLEGLRDAMEGRRDAQMRRVIASYVDGITLWPSTKTGEMSLGADAYALYEKNDRPAEGRSWENVVAGARHVPFRIRAALRRKFRFAA